MGSLASTNTRGEAQALLTDTLSRLGDGSYAAPSKVTVADYLTGEWLPAAAGTLRPLSAAKYRQTIKAYIVPRIGSTRLQALSGGILNGLYRELEQAGLSISTVRGVHTVLSRSLRDAERWERVPRNVARMADPPSRERSRAQAWVAGEVSRFLEHVAGDRLYGLWRLAATTGMRRGELAAVTWRALALEGSRLHVEHQLIPTHGGISFGPPKSARSRRTVALDPESVDILRCHRETQLLERDLAGDAYDDCDLVFCDELGAPFRPERVTEWFGRHRKAAGIPTGTLHTRTPPDQGRPRITRLPLEHLTSTDSYTPPSRS